VTGPQSLTVASIVSRRAGRCSDLAHGTGMHRIDLEARIHHDNPHPYVINVTKVRLVSAARHGRGRRRAAPGARD